MKSKITAEKVFAAVIIVLFGVIIVKSFLSFSGKEYYETALAEYDTFYITDTVEGYVIRDDDIVSGSVNGTLIPTVSEGTKVEKNGEVARVFRNTDYALNIDKRNSIQQELDYYSNLKTNADDYVNNISVYSKNILSSVCKYAGAIDSGSQAVASSASDDVREYITVKQIVLGQEINVEAKIEELEAELRAVDSGNLDSTYSSVTIKKSGYYFSTADGCEGSGDYEKVKEISCEEIENLLTSAPKVDTGLGKIVYNPIWYFVCIMTGTQAAQLEVGNDYSISFNDSAVENIVMKVESKNEEKGEAGTAELSEMDKDENRKIAVVFSSKVMNEEVASLRKVSAEICFIEYSGIVVPNSAVRTVTFTETEDVTDEYGKETGEKKEKKVDRTGVYIKLNNISKFREMEILYRNDEYTVATYEPDNESSRYLKIHDEIFINGVNFENEHIISGGYFS